MFSCKNNSIKDEDKLHLIKKENKSSKNFTSIRNEFWYSKTGVFQIEFFKDKVKYYVTPTHIYTFKSFLKKDTLNINWDYSLDSTNDDVLAIQSKIIKHPNKKDVFAKLYFVNDSIIKIDYLFKDWINEINLNQELIDTIFPSTFYYRKI